MTARQETSAMSRARTVKAATLKAKKDAGHHVSVSAWAADVIVTHLKGES